MPGDIEEFVLDHVHTHDYMYDLTHDQELDAPKQQPVESARLMPLAASLDGSDASYNQRRSRNFTLDFVVPLLANDDSRRLRAASGFGKPGMLVVTSRRVKIRSIQDDNQERGETAISRIPNPTVH